MNIQKYCNHPSSGQALLFIHPLTSCLGRLLQSTDFVPQQSSEHCSDFARGRLGWIVSATRRSFLVDGPSVIDHGISHDITTPRQTTISGTRAPRSVYGFSQTGTTGTPSYSVSVVLVPCPKRPHSVGRRVWMLRQEVCWPRSSSPPQDAIQPFQTKTLPQQNHPPPTHTGWTGLAATRSIHPSNFDHTHGSPAGLLAALRPRRTAAGESRAFGVAGRLRIDDPCRGKPGASQTDRPGDETGCQGSRHEELVHRGS